jgi:hypothetical protein
MLVDVFRKPADLSSLRRGVDLFAAERLPQSRNTRLLRPLALSGGQRVDPRVDYRE